MTYFVDPYKKYYEKLSAAESITQKANTISSTISSLSTNSKNIASKISASTWKEIGAEEVVNKILPGVNALFSKINNDVVSTLSVAVSKCMTEILPKSKELKEKDEKFDQLKTEIANLKSNEPDKYDKDNKVTSEHSSWSRMLLDKTEEQDVLREECEKLQEEINAVVTTINGLEVSKASDTTFTVGTNTDYGEIIENDGTFVKINYSGSTFKVINTQNISVTDFVEYLSQYRLYQSQQPKYDSACLGVAKAYGKKLYYANSKLYSNMDGLYSGAYLQWDNGTTSPDKQYILRLIYDELVQGKPCVLMVTTKRGTRHFATVVGMKDSVTSADSIREEDLLIIDSWDGKLEAMDNSVTADRHMHFENGGYRVDRLMG